jgi:riboflavin biosynthesis pyrimidine reductase
LDLDRAVFQTSGVRVLIITSARGKQNLAEKGSEALQLVEVKTLPDADGRIAPSAILKLLREEYGARLVLHEGGPTLLGEFFTERVIDELFLTIAPQVAGRVPEHPRPGLVSQVEFLPSNAPWMQLVSAKQSQDYLYLRYRTTPKSR